MVYLGAKGETAAQMAQVGTPGPLSHDRRAAHQPKVRTAGAALLIYTKEVQGSVSRGANERCAFVQVESNNVNLELINDLCNKNVIVVTAGSCASWNLFR